MWEKRLTLGFSSEGEKKKKAEMEGREGIVRRGSIYRASQANLLRQPVGVSTKGRGKRGYRKHWKERKRLGFKKDR